MNMSHCIKNLIRDKSVEPRLRWLVKRMRAIPVPYDNVKNEVYDRQAKDVIRRVLRADSNCVDAGCHEGRYLEWFMQLAPRGRHVAFEPLPHLAARLRRRFPGATVHQAALGDFTGTARFFFVKDAPALSRVVAPGETGPGGVETLEVPVVTLDAALPESTPVHFIKVDVEGAEGKVLAGGLRTIAGCRPFVVFEHGAASSERMGFSSGAVFALLAEAGLRVSLLSDWLFGRPPLSRERFPVRGEWYYLAHR